MIRHKAKCLFDIGSFVPVTNGRPIEIAERRCSDLAGTGCPLDKKRGHPGGDNSVGKEARSFTFLARVIGSVHASCRLIYLYADAASAMQFGA